MVAGSTPSLFQGYGIELEYMIVRNGSLDILALADRLLETVGGRIIDEVEFGDIAWSNELALHVVELKTNGPVAALDGVEARFQANIETVNEVLADFGARLMPTAMHPWMDPHRETRLWPHGSRIIYEAYNRIFGCQGHGWANVQSTHLNLAFSGDREFGPLHAAIRLVLPLLPALAASSPLVEGTVSGLLDTRLEFYRFNQKRIPSIAGAVIPEPAYSRRDYEEKILRPSYRDIAPFDPGGILQHEWLNSRGAIARFDRCAIEIRVLDIQECPAADLAVTTAIVSVLKALAAERWTSFAEQAGFDTGILADILVSSIRHAEETVIENRDYLHHFGVAAAKITAAELWRELIDRTVEENAPQREQLAVILGEGPLARRILKALGGTTRRDSLHQVYSELCACLATGRMFTA